MEARWDIAINIRLRRAFLTENSIRLREDLLLEKMFSIFPSFFFHVLIMLQFLPRWLLRRYICHLLVFSLVRDNRERDYGSKVERRPIEEEEDDDEMRLEITQQQE